MSSKSYRLQQLVAASIKLDKNPSKTGFAEFIHQLTASYFQITRRSSREYLRTLIDSWKFDKWRTLVTINAILSEREKAWWNNNH